jgi:ferrous iron transport protein B
VLLRAYDRLKTFLFKAGKVLIPVIMVLSFLNSLGTDGSFGNENTENSALASMSKVITPVLKPLGVKEENWPATVGIFTGIFAKEAVVGTLDALYTGINQQADTGEKATKEAFDFWGGISGAFTSVPEKLLGVLDTFTDPLKLSIGDVSDATTAAEEQKVSASTFGSMVTLFGSQSAAFAYLLFILLYFPCSAAISAVYRETNLAWTAFAGFWTTFLAYLASTLFYQAVNFLAHPGYSLLVIAADLCAFSCVILVLNSIGKTNQRSKSTVSIAEKIRPSFAGER